MSGRSELRYCHSTPATIFAGSEGDSVGSYRMQEISGGLGLSGPRVQAVNGYCLNFGPLICLQNSGVRGSEPSSSPFIT